MACRAICLLQRKTRLPFASVVDTDRRIDQMAVVAL